MITFQDIINKKLGRIETKGKVEELIKLFMDFGLKLNKISEETVVFVFPDNPFGIQGKIKIDINRRGVLVEMVSSCTYNSFTRGYSFSDYTPTEILEHIINEIEKIA